MFFAFVFVNWLVSVSAKFGGKGIFPDKYLSMSDGLPSASAISGCCFSSSCFTNNGLLGSCNLFTRYSLYFCLSAVFDKTMLSTTFGGSGIPFKTFCLSVSLMFGYLLNIFSFSLFDTLGSFSFCNSLNVSCLGKFGSKRFANVSVKFGGKGIEPDKYWSILDGLPSASFISGYFSNNAFFLSIEIFGLFNCFIILFATNEFIVLVSFFMIEYNTSFVSGGNGIVPFI